LTTDIIKLLHGGYLVKGVKFEVYHHIHQVTFARTTTTTRLLLSFYSHYTLQDNLH